MIPKFNWWVTCWKGSDNWWVLSIGGGNLFGPFRLKEMRCDDDDDDDDDDDVKPYLSTSNKFFSMLVSRGCLNQPLSAQHR